MRTLIYRSCTSIYPYSYSHSCCCTCSNREANVQCSVALCVLYITSVFCRVRSLFPVIESYCNASSAPTVPNARPISPLLTVSSVTRAECSFGFESSGGAADPFFTCEPHDATAGRWSPVTHNCTEKVTGSPFRLEMQAFADLQLQHPVGPPPTLSLGSALYMQLNASGVPEGAALFVDACEAVSAEDADEKRVVIAEGCAADAGTAFISPHDRSAIAFRLQAFRFSRAPEHHIDLRCHMRMCNMRAPSANCSRSCYRVQHPEIERPSGRQRRSIGRSASESDPIEWDQLRLSVYPIVLHNARTQASRLGPLSVFTGVLMFAILLGVAWEISSIIQKRKGVGENA